MPGRPHTFAITGLGRSGTQWLAMMLDRHSDHEVRHEAGGWAGRGYKQAAKRFREARRPYGEVNSYLRWCFAQLPADGKGVILRNPWEVLYSAVARHRGRGDRRKCIDLGGDPAWRYWVDIVAEGIDLLDSHLRGDPEVVLLTYRAMTTNATYLRRRLRDLGVAAPTLQAEALAQPINASARGAIEDAQDHIPQGARQLAAKRFEWFIDAHNL